jgi:hypothetical protein
MKKTLFPVAVLIVCLSFLTCSEPYIDKDKIYTITFYHDNAYSDKDDEGEVILHESAKTSAETDMKGKLSRLPTTAKQDEKDLDTGALIRSFTFTGWFTTGGTKVSLQTVFHADTLVVARWRASDEVDKNAPDRFTEWLTDIKYLDPLPPTREFKVNEDMNIKPQILDFGGRSITITIYSDKLEIPTLSLSGFGALFTVENGVTLILENIRLEGKRNTSSLVVVNSGGKLIMKAGEDPNTKERDKLRTAITGNGSEKKECGGGVTVNIGGTFEMEGGLIAGNYAYDPTEDFFLSTAGGGGVLVRGGVFKMTGGQIMENEATNGGGVLVTRGGTFIMGPFAKPDKDGEIYKNSANEGGGVKVAGGINNLDGSVGESVFIMQGEKSPNETRGKIAENVALGGGVSVGFRGIFHLKGGIIYKNLGSDAGGIQNSRGIVFMYTGGEVIENKGPWSAGGVMNQGMFYMYGGKISNNFGGLGGGVSNFLPPLLGLGGWFHMWGGEISNNTGDGSGGGVVNDAFFYMHGGEIYGNHTNFGMGGGVYNGNPGYEDDGIFVITGGTIYGTDNPTDKTKENYDNGGQGGSFYILGGLVAWGRRGYYELVEDPVWKTLTPEQKKDADPRSQYLKNGTGNYVYTFVPDKKYENTMDLTNNKKREPFTPDISIGKPEIDFIDWGGKYNGVDIKMPTLKMDIGDVDSTPKIKQGNSNSTLEVRSNGVYVDGTLIADFNDTDWKGE